MLVKDIMTRHPIMISSDTAAAEAQQIMTENQVRHLPVVGDGKRLLGLITRQSLALKPNYLSSLDVWEITRRLGNLTVKDLMVRGIDVITTTPDRTVERAAQTMTDHKIGCLPVVEEDVVVGIVTDFDLLCSYQVMLGLPSPGVRVTVRMPNRPGEFAKMMSQLASRGMGVMGVGTYPTPRQEGYYDAILKIPKVTSDQVREALSQVEGQQVIDIREFV